ncbi:MAG: Acetohydroxy acid synthase [uncultured Thermomicrobiales bacterium]|uniref:Acetohydroxy acid synthase n=1 Tax=uncultured Thermomicrobiales bacterium TaxID=1645740 RepID=A0A6J4VMD8_9BACT|nr:MAG: Acetohydroxy acid synthase [uncultured Thermomicrobiales bacterium]
MTRMTGGQALVRSIKREGVDTIFGLPGIQLDWAFDALWEERDTIRVLHTRHEQACGYMADGYARSTGQVGTCLVVPGPGLLNTTAALSTAYACSSPVLCLTGQIQSNLIGGGRGELHEIPDQLEMIRSVTKWAARALRPEEIPGLVREAFRQLRTGRPRPVELEIPPDVLATEAEIELLDPAAPERSAGDPDLLRRTAAALAGAERPLIFVGGGIFAAEAWPELRALAEVLQAPVVMTENGRGALSDRHPLGLNALAGKRLLPEADVVLAVGTRFLRPAAMWGLPEGATTIRLDVDPEEVGRNVTPTIGIVGDAKLGLAAILAAVDGGRKRPSREAELAAVKEEIANLLFETQPQASFAGAIRAALPDDGVLVNEMTQVGYWSYTGFPVYEPRTFLTPGYQGTLGYGFATALGAQVGNPGKKVVSVNGDGGFGYNLQELSTMKRHGINVAAVVFSDGAYGNVRRIQQESFGGHTIASDLLNPDWVKLAESFGVAAVRVHGPDALEGALREALATNEPVLLDVPVGEMPRMTQLLYSRGTPPAPAKRR